MGVFACFLIKRNFILCAEHQDLQQSGRLRGHLSLHVEQKQSKKLLCTIQFLAAFAKSPVKLNC
jgi:hypothetical protein